MKKNNFLSVKDKIIRYQTGFKQNWFFILIIAVAAFLRIREIGRGWVYDEIWGLMHWVNHDNWSILTTLENQNNHPLNSIFMKYAFELFGLNAIAVRFHSLAAGILLIPAVYLLVIIWLRNRYIAILSSLLTAAHGGLIYFSQVARGYSLETFLVALFALLSMTWIRHSDKLSRHARWGIAFGLAAAMIAGCMTLCTAILFIVPVMLYQLCSMLAEYLPDKGSLYGKLSKLVRKNIELMLSWVVITAFAAFLYIGNYDKFVGAVPAAGGVVIDSPGSLFLFLKNIFAELMPYWLLLPLAFAFFKTGYVKVVILVAGMCAFAFSTVFFAKGGPVRAYLPLVPFLCIGAACGFQVLSARIKERYRRFPENAGLVVLSVICIVGLNPGMEQWDEPDGKADFRAVSKLPADYMVVYTACHSLPMAFNNRPEIYRDNYSRISSCMDGGRLLLLRNQKDHISVLNNQKSEASIPLNVPGRSVTYHRLDFQEYELRRLQTGDAAGNRAILAVVPFNSILVVNTAINYLRSHYDNNWLPLNCWLHEPLSAGGSELYSAVALVFPPHPAPPVDEFVEIERKSTGKIRFFRIIAVSGKSSLPASDL